MQVFYKISELRNFLKPHRSNSIGLVPTMGALHEGHLSLIDFSKNENDLTICSIFVNPTQFNNPNDLQNYPRRLENDLFFLEKAGCDVVFAPSDSEIYPKKPSLKIHFGQTEESMEGAFRPGHFNGVGIVVAKLFNIVQPDRAYFGQKDLQQCAVVSRLIDDLSFPVELRRCPTVRETDGLAMSSRNLLLDKQQRQIAPKLHEALQITAQSLRAEKDLEKARQKGIDFLKKDENFKIEYLEVVDSQTLSQIANFENTDLAVCVAASLGNVRLIDNILI